MCQLRNFLFHRRHLLLYFWSARRHGKRSESRESPVLDPVLDPVLVAVLVSVPCAAEMDDTWSLERDVRGWCVLLRVGARFVRVGVCFRGFVRGCVCFCALVRVCV
ncbi:hypothetical protein WMY93_008726 [Mugilogobius chulae]|uniref:Uncharacterized protein n=1 Tax=Mugilogobius chulae TaxID=88201 RepID=A0AAW0PN19_9GOBI